MATHLAESTVCYVPKFREYGIPVLDGGTAKIIISFCPWCGQKLPASLRDKWFELIDEMGVDYDDAPDRFLSDQWWKQLDE
jgi:hypothetical protein